MSIANLPSGNTADAQSAVKSFDWPLANDGEALVRQQIGEFLEKNSFARRLAGRMVEESATDFFEWIDHLVMSPEMESALREAGFARDAAAETPDGAPVLEHPRATLPRVILRAGLKHCPSVIALRP
ncbi:MAG TPA: hypothetical protein VHH88_11010, partial [Verrucomicrobiae bacterium]|nr:hypothetical protein [Verrucomicrobiae bacterium]